jgi:hypothetical protein
MDLNRPVLHEAEEAEYNLQDEGGHDCKKYFHTTTDVEVEINASGLKKLTIK